MKIKLPFILILVSFSSIGCEQNTVNCNIETSEGTITIKLYPEKAPNTVANFLRYVDNNLYEKSSFFRVCNNQNEADRDIKIEVIQGGNVDVSKAFPPIKMETTKLTGLKHLNGTVSMARMGPDTATCEFFICINDQPELDYQGKRNPDGQGFAAFGKVTKGMDVVLKINSEKDEGQYLINPIVINSITRIP
jgi:peptidyl-prolyl cis-trans isomerase A (cyclophilin A)